MSPGISVSKIPIPFFGGGGTDWDAYWASLISATVENAAPTHVVMTFPAAETLVATDLTATVNGAARAVSSASWTGAVWTAVLASAVVYGDVVVMTFVPSGGTAAVTNNVLDTRFKITVDTTKAGSADTHFVLPVTAKSAASYFVDWGEGGAEEEFTTTGNKDHTYAASGTYQVKVRGGMTALSFNNGGDKLKLMSIDNWGNIAWSSFNGAFWGCSNMVGTYLDNPNTSAVTNMYSMFNGCPLFNGHVSGFNTAAVTNMAYMFSACSVFNQSVANFNTAKVANMNNMFRNCPAFKQSLATFSLDAATNIGEMLVGSTNINATGTTTNYDATLVAWAAADVPNSLSFNGGTSKYSLGTGAAARQSLIDDDLWTIADGGLL